MRRGIGLRGYAQQDPLNEFRREAFALYTELRDLIRHQLANTIFRVTVTRQPAPSPTDMPMPDAATLSALRDGGDGATARRVGRLAPRLRMRPRPSVLQPGLPRSLAACRRGRACWASANRSATRSSVADRPPPARCGPATPRPASGSAATMPASAAPA